jgi:hypothetical protein
MVELDVAVVAAVVSGVVTALVTAHSVWGLWVALGVLVVVGAVLQVAVVAWRRRSERRAPSMSQVTATGPGSIASGGSIKGTISTRPPIDKSDSPRPTKGLGGDQRGD